MKKRYLNRILLAAAAAMTLTVSLSISAFASNVLVAPGVSLNTNTSDPSVAPISAESTGETAASAVMQPVNTGSSAPVISDGPGGPAVSANQGTAQVGAADTASLIEISKANPYTIYPTDDPNIVVSRGRTIDKTKPMITLTYDDGPQTAAGNRIIDIFSQYGQRATFFMVGDRVPSRASEVQRMAAEGHEVANHTYSHTYLNKVSAETIRNQVVACNDIIEQTCGVRPRIMRLPGGNKNSTVLANVNMPIILWNVDTKDWSHRNTAKIMGAIMGKVKDGDVVLMHELYDATAAASEQMVPQLVAQGFQLVTVSELAELKGIALNNNQIYYSF